jgi:hypothetical protein
VDVRGDDLACRAAFAGGERGERGPGFLTREASDRGVQERGVQEGERAGAGVGAGGVGDEIREFDRQRGGAQLAGLHEHVLVFARIDLPKHQ